MKKGERIQAYVESLGTGSEQDSFYLAYFICFNEQKYYEAHDVLEQLWLKSSEPTNQFFKGLIQLAGAFVHLQKQHSRPEHLIDGRRIRPAWRLFKLARVNLEPFSPRFLDLDVRSVVELCSRNILEIERTEFQHNPWTPVVAPKLAVLSAAVDEQACSTVKDN